MFSRSRPLLDFGAGLLIGSSITVALFAAMEESDGGLSHDMLLAALVALALAAVLKFAARHRRPRGAVRSANRRDETAVGTGWTVEAAAAGKTAAAASNSDDRSVRDARASRALADLPAAHRNAQASAADGDTRRL